MKMTCFRTNRRILVPAFGKLIIVLLMQAIASATREGEQDGNSSERLLGHLTDEEIYENTVNDERTHRTYVSTSKLGSNIARGLSSLSIVSLLILITLIFRSRAGLSTLYHRIVFCMSVASILAAMAMGLTTLPMPKDMIYTQFETAVYGNQATCTAQGLVYIAGTRTAFLYFASLCIYYLSSIRFKMSESKMRKRIEPWIHRYIFCSTTAVTTLCIVSKFINPSPDRPWCAPMQYPWYCTPDNWRECFIRDTDVTLSSSAVFIIYVENLVTIIIFFSTMALIVWTVYKQERLIKTYMARVRGHTSGNNSRNLAMCRSRHQFTRTIMLQALSYLVVFVLFAWDIFYIAFKDLISRFGGQKFTDLPLWIRYYYLTSKPVQGFVYFLVFVGHKVYGIRHVRSDLTILQAIRYVFMVREEPKYFISRISLVNSHGVLDNEGDEDEMHFVDDDEDDCEDEDIPRMYPFPGQNFVDGVDVTAGGAGSGDARGELSSFGPSSWFSLSTTRSEATRNRRKAGHTVDENDAISGISGKTKIERQDDDMEEIEISESVDTFADDSGGTDSDSRGVLSSIGPASWFSRSSTGKSESSSINQG
jgi:hypothetical protein